MKFGSMLTGLCMGGLLLLCSSCATGSLSHSPRLHLRIYAESGLPLRDVQVRSDFPGGSQLSDSFGRVSLVLSPGNLPAEITLKHPLYMTVTVSLAARPPAGFLALRMRSYGSIAEECLLLGRQGRYDLAIELMKDAISSLKEHPGKSRQDETARRMQFLHGLFLYLDGGADEAMEAIEEIRNTGPEIDYLESLVRKELQP